MDQNPRVVKLIPAVNATEPQPHKYIRVESRIPRQRVPHLGSGILISLFVPCSFLVRIRVNTRSFRSTHSQSRRYRLRLPSNVEYSLHFSLLAGKLVEKSSLKTSTYSWTARSPDLEGRESLGHRALGPYRDDGQLGRATKSNRKESSPDAATNIHLRTVLGVPTFQETSRPAGQPEDRYQRQTDLSAVRVPGEHEGARGQRYYRKTPARGLQRLHRHLGGQC